MAQPRTAGLTKGQIARPQVKQRAPVRCVADARAIMMIVIGRQTISMKHRRIMWIGLPVFDPVKPRCFIIRARVVAINCIGKGRYQNTKFSPRLTQFRADKERHGIILCATADPHNIHPRRQISRNDKTKVSVPFKVINLILMKRDRTVMRRFMTPVHFAGIP